MFERPDAGERAILVHVSPGGQPDEEDIREFVDLVSSADVEPVALIQGSRRVPDPRLFIGGGKLEEVRTLSASHPEMAAFLPLKIAVFAENDETVIAAFNPLDLARAMPAEELQPYFRSWNQDIKAVLADVRRLGKE